MNTHPTDYAPCRWPLSHRDKHRCSCVCVLPKGHKGRHDCTPIDGNERP